MTFGDSLPSARRLVGFIATTVTVITPRLPATIAIARTRARVRLIPERPLNCIPPRCPEKIDRRRFDFSKREETAEMVYGNMPDPSRIQRPALRRENETTNAGGSNRVSLNPQGGLSRSLRRHEDRLLRATATAGHRLEGHRRAVRGQELHPHGRLAAAHRDDLEGCHTHAVREEVHRLVRRGSVFDRHEDGPDERHGGGKRRHGRSGRPLWETGRRRRDATRHWRRVVRASRHVGWWRRPDRRGPLRFRPPPEADPEKDCPDGNPAHSSVEEPGGNAVDGYGLSAALDGAFVTRAMARFDEVRASRRQVRGERAAGPRGLRDV